MKVLWFRRGCNDFGALTAYELKSGKTMYQGQYPA